MQVEAGIIEGDINSGKIDLLALGHKLIRKPAAVGIDSHSYHLETKNLSRASIMPASS